MSGGSASGGHLPSRRTLFNRAVGGADDLGRQPDAPPIRAEKVKVVAWAIGSFMDAEGCCFPSRQTIKDCASVSVKTVDRALVVLEARGLLAIERSDGGRRQGGRGSSNRYRALIPSNLWHLWSDDLVDELQERYVLGEDDELAGLSNGVRSALNGVRSESQRRQERGQRRHKGVPRSRS